MSDSPAASPPVHLIGDTGRTATDHAEHHARECATIDGRLRRNPVPADDLEARALDRIDGHVVDAMDHAHLMPQLARQQLLRDLWAVAAQADRGEATVEKATHQAARWALRAMRADLSTTSLAVRAVERAHRTAARDWLVNARSHGMLDAAMILDML